MQTMTINQFMQRDTKADLLISKLTAHLKKHHIKYKIVGTTITILVVGGVDFATPTLAASGMDQMGRTLYFRLLSLGKWIIIFKGAIETIKSVGNGDFDGAKKHFFSYILVFLTLLGLPWAFDEIEKLFEEMT